MRERRDCLLAAMVAFALITTGQIAASTFVRRGDIHDERAALIAVLVLLSWWVCGAAIAFDAYSQCVWRSGWGRFSLGVTLGFMCFPIIFPPAALVSVDLLVASTPPALRAMYTDSVVTSLVIRLIVFSIVVGLGALLVPRILRARVRSWGESIRIAIAILALYSLILGCAIVIA